MRDRESTFSDPRVQKLLEARFVATALDCHYWRSRDDRSTLCLLSYAKRVHQLAFLHLRAPFDPGGPSASAKLCQTEVEPDLDTALRHSLEGLAILGRRVGLDDLAIGAEHERRYMLAHLLGRLRVFRLYVSPKGQRPIKGILEHTARLDHVDELDTIIQSFIGQRTLLENLTFFEKEQVTVGPVYDSPDFETDAHVKARGIMVEVPDNDLGSIPMHDVVPRLSRTPGAIRRKAPDLGDDEFEILGPLCG